MGRHWSCVRVCSPFPCLLLTSCDRSGFICPCEHAIIHTSASTAKLAPLLSAPLHGRATPPDMGCARSRVTRRTNCYRPAPPSLHPPCKCTRWVAAGRRVDGQLGPWSHLLPSDFIHLSGRIFGACFNCWMKCLGTNGATGNRVYCCVCGASACSCLTGLFDAHHLGG